MFHSFDPMDCNLCPGKNTGMGSYSLLQRIFPTQESNLGICTAGRVFTIWATSHSELCWVLSHSVLFNSLRPHGLQHIRHSCLAPSPGTCSNSHPLSRWCHPIISSSVLSFSSCLQSFLELGSCLMSQLFVSCGQSIGASASASVLPKNIQDWFPLGLTGLISLQSKGLSRVISNTTVQKNQFFSAQLSLESSSDILTWLLEKP